MAEFRLRFRTRGASIAAPAFRAASALPGDRFASPALSMLMRRRVWSDRLTSLPAINGVGQNLRHDNAATPDHALDEVSNAEKRRFEARIDDPIRQ